MAIANLGFGSQYNPFALGDLQSRMQALSGQQGAGGMPAFQGVNPNPQGANAPVAIGPGQGGILGPQQVFGAPGAATVGMGGPSPAPLPTGAPAPRPWNPNESGPVAPPVSAAQAAMQQINLDPRSFGGGVPNVTAGQAPIDWANPSMQPLQGTPSGMTGAQVAGALGAAAQFAGQMQDNRRAPPVQPMSIQHVGQRQPVQSGISMFRPIMPQLYQR